MAAFAADLNVTPGYLSNLISGGGEWTAPRIRQACELLDIPAEDVGEYFLGMTPGRENA